MGGALYGLFDCHFGFRSWREVGRYPAKRRKALGLHEVNFSLLRESFRSLAREYMPESSDKRVCLSIDPVSHRAYVLIDPHTGEVTELTEPLLLNRETALLLKNDSDAFDQFLRHHAHMVTKFSFVLYLIRLDTRAKAFPMAILPAVHGYATDDTLLSLSFALQILEDEGVDI
jgi:hypothetical protein